MLIKTTNQQPSLLKSFYLGSISNDFDPFETIRDKIVTPLFTPIVPTSPVTINANGTDLNADDITSILLRCSAETVHPSDEDCMKEILSQTLVYYDKALAVQDVYAVQAAKKMNMPLPSPRVIYTASDIIDVSKQFLANQITTESFFATFAFYIRLSTFGFYFANTDAWNDFKAWFAQEIAQISNLLSSDTVKLCQDLQTITLQGLTESFVLRDNSSQNNDPYSFARIFQFYLMLYEQKMTQANNMPCIAGHLPFSFMDHFCPLTMVIINIEKHAHAHPNQIANEWDTIKQSMLMKPKVVGSSTLKKLTAVTRLTKKILGSNKNGGMTRSAVIKFRKTPTTSFDFYKYVERLYKHTQFVIQSQNEVKYKKISYNRPNRRHPDNPDRPGYSHGLKYKPDIHIYLDCSGSISERNYQDAIKSCIKFARKIGIDLYFTSFSHIMSTTTKLPVKGRTTKQIYDAFKNIPKVGGGTDYEQIWHYINKSKKLQSEFSIVITDFEYYAPNHFVKHPEHLYYAPISTADWNQITDSATDFAKSMLNICSNIRKKIFM